jgi:hypothetical protein
MRVGPEEMTRVVKPLVRDLQTTLGWTEARARSVIRPWVENMSANLDDWFDGSSETRTREEVEFALRILLVQAIGALPGAAWKTRRLWFRSAR